MTWQTQQHQRLVTHPASALHSLRAVRCVMPASLFSAIVPNGYTKDSGEKPTGVLRG